MKLHKWKDIKDRNLSPERQARVRAEVEHELLEMNLRQLRTELGKTQADIAKAAEMAQGELSRVERRSDHLVSTLRTYVEALGGELRVTAVFPDKEVHLKNV